MSYTYYICPYCRVATYPSFMGREYRYCGQCGHMFDIDDTEAVTVGQSAAGTHRSCVSHASEQHPAVGPSTAKVQGVRQ